MGSFNIEETLFSADALLQSLSFELSLPIIIGCIVISFFGLKLYRVAMAASGAYSFGIGAYYLTALLILTGVIPADALGGKLTLIVAFSAATLGLILSFFLDKVVLFVAGTAGGYFGTQTLAGLFFADLMSPVVLIIVSAVIGVILGILLCVIFKPVYIILTSVGGMGVAGFMMGLLLFPPTEGLYSLIFLGAGALIGIIPAAMQFKSESDRRYR